VAESDVSVLKQVCPVGPHTGTLPEHLRTDYPNAAEERA
jgi:hypothetical protein